MDAEYIVQLALSLSISICMAIWFIVKQTKEFNVVRQLKPNLSKAVYHTSLNLPYSDSNKLTDEEFSSLGIEYLEVTNLNNYIIYPNIKKELKKNSFDNISYLGNIWE